MDDHPENVPYLVYLYSLVRNLFNVTNHTEDFTAMPSDEICSQSKSKAYNSSIGVDDAICYLYSLARNLSNVTDHAEHFSVMPSDEMCPQPESKTYNSSIGVDLAVPEWEAIVMATAMSIIVIFTIVGNVLVILSVFTHKPLRIVQNFFLVSLAVADLTVAAFVLPLNIAYSILGQWLFGIRACKMWLTCDVLCCTASILNLCAISLDRYWAITDPLNYAQKRTLKRVLIMIGCVWFLSAIISSPPLLGWNDWDHDFNASMPCRLAQEEGFVVYSSLGSFYIPLFIMTIVYSEIFVATKRRFKQRSRASRLNTLNLNVYMHVPNNEISLSSERRPSCCVPVQRSKSMKETVRRKLSVIVSRNASEASTASNEPDDNGDVVKVCDDATSVTSSVPTTPALSRQLSQPQFNAVQKVIQDKQRISLTKERKAARTLGIIMGVFVVCWLPFFLMYVILPFCPNCCVSYKLENFIIWLGYVNSALNPIIYTTFNMDFRKAFKKLLHLKV